LPVGVEKKSSSHRASGEKNLDVQTKNAESDKCNVRVEQARSDGPFNPLKQRGRVGFGSFKGEGRPKIEQVPEGLKKVQLTGRRKKSAMSGISERILSLLKDLVSMSKQTTRTRFTASGTLKFVGQGRCSYGRR